MTSELHPDVRKVIESPTPEAALRLARAAASAAWTEQVWLTVAAAANSLAISEPRWLALCVFAHERRSAEVASVDALTKRARLLVACGPDEGDELRDPAVFFRRVRRFIGGDAAQASLRRFQRAMELVFHAERDSVEWSEARVQFIRGRRLRDVGQALRSVANAGIIVPSDLTEWLVWADVREVDGKVLT